MSNQAEAYRAKARAKAERLVRGSSGPIDASGWREPMGEMGDIQTGPRPVSRQAFRRGGKVAGHAGVAHYGRKPRASGGGSWKPGVGGYTDHTSSESSGAFNVLKDASMRPHVLSKYPSTDKVSTPGMTAARRNRASGGKALADALINRDVKEANNSRSGEKHIGGMDCGGRAMRASGGGNWIAGAIKHPGALHKEMGIPSGEKIPAKKLNAAADKGGKLGARARLAKTLKGFHHASGGAIPDGTRPAGGRLARKGGGRTKKGMNVNIIIAPSGQSPRPAMPPPGALPPPGAGPLGMHQGAPPPPPMAPPGMPPPGAGGPMMRKAGGKVNHALAKPGAYPLDHASGGGKGRLEKIKAYGANAKA